MDNLNNNSPLPTGGLDGHRSGPPSLNERLNKKADLSEDFPVKSPNIKIENDLDNKSHKGQGHYDMMNSIEGGAEKTRITPNGRVLGGTTQIGPHKADWG